MKGHVVNSRMEPGFPRSSYTLRVLVLVTLTAALLFAYSFLNRSVVTEVVTSPDEDVALFFSQHIVETSAFTWHSDLNEEFDVSFFRPRLAREIGENTYIGPYPHFELILALARIYGVLDYIVGLTAILGVFGIYLLGREVGGNKVGLCSAFVYGFLPPFLMDANKFLSMIPAVSFAIFSIFCLLKGVKTKRNSYYCLSAVFLAGATMIRADFALLLLPYLIVLAANRRSVTIRHFVVSLVSFTVLILPGYIYFYRILPSISTRPFALPLSAHISTTLQNLTAYPSTFLSYLLLNPLPLSLIGLPALVWIIQTQKTAPLRSFAYLSVPLLVVYLLAYGARTGTWGYWDVAPDASMFRYFLLPYAILSVCFAVLAINTNWWNNRFSASLILLTLFLSLLITSSASQLTKDRARLEVYAEIKNVVAALPKEAVLFTKSWDKIVGSSTRSLAIYRTHDDVQKDPDLAYFFRPVDIGGDLVPLVDRLLDSGRLVYVLSDADELTQSLRSHGYSIVAVPQIGYKVLQPVSSS